MKLNPSVTPDQSQNHKQHSVHLTRSEEDHVFQLSKS
ncbi:rCG52157 [Rattus norvegicus]|uniref:RCG52157 n=1 Tax=Rattus norvegicus TaxID=10116 RepID=A6K6P8_RAT|nr:rCG52157 [Rattus norvegicus]